MILVILKPVNLIAFSTAFDMVYDQSSSLEVIIKLGFDRILTSGGKPDALVGAFRLKSLVNQVFFVFQEFSRYFARTFAYETRKSIHI